MVRSSPAGLQEVAVNALASLRKANYPVSSFCNIDLGTLAEEQGFDHRESLSASVDCVLGDQSQDIGRVWDDEKSEYNISASADTKSILELCSEMLQPGASMHINCSALQFRPWNREQSKDFDAHEGTGRYSFDSDREWYEKTSKYWGGIYSALLHACCWYLHSLPYILHPTAY